MKVKILVGTHAYACITHTTGSMDVQLAAGHSPEFSLAQSARELREKAESMIRRADIMDQAAGYLVAQKEKWHETGERIPCDGRTALPRFHVGH